MEELVQNYNTFYDISTGEAIYESRLNPADITQEQRYWLFVRNNKYDKNEIDPSKVGKWMLFVYREYINEVWGKIKDSVRSGYLWDCKVSTVNTAETHAVMIYTKDYTDLEDVVNVLNHLEEAGIKKPETVIYYKTDKMTRAGIYAKGKQKASIYSSNTIRIQ